MYTIIVDNLSGDECYIVEGNNIYIKSIYWENMDEYAKYWKEPKNILCLDIPPINIGNYHKKIHSGGCEVILVYYTDKEGNKGMLGYSDEWTLNIKNNNNKIICSRKGEKYES